MSSNCSVCGCAEFNLIDGFFYCAICSSQSQVQREVDTEDANVVDSLAAILATKITTKKTAADDGKGKRRSKYQPSDEQLVALAAVANEDYPHLLKRGGLRLGTFTKDHALCIFQRYLRRMNIAFCDEEITEENPYCPLVKNTEYEAQLKKKQQQLKLEKERSLHSGRDILSQLTCNDLDENLTAHATREEVCKHSEILVRVAGEAQLKKKQQQLKLEKERSLHSGRDILSQLTCNDLDENLTAHATREEVIEQGEVQLVIKAETKLSVEAFNRLLVVPLSHQILLVICYVACLCAGANWILLSDIARWYREGRLPMSFLQRFALVPILPGSDDDTRHCGVASLSTPILCLFEMMRFVLAVCQMADIPARPIGIDFDQIVCRFCFNLNLPMVFVDRVRALSAYVKPSCDLSERLTKRFGDFDSSILLRYPFSSSLFKMDFGFEDKLPGLFHHDTGAFNKHRCMLPTPEAKAVALILFALKLTFGLDDHREYNMDDRASFTDGSYENFDFSLWMHQLKMRMDVWRGRTLKNVLEKRKHISASCLTDEMLNRVRYTKTHDGRKVPWCVGKPYLAQDTSFKGCVPNYVVNEAKECAFYSTFADDLEPRPAKWLDKEALLAPLRYQATRNDEWYENLLDEEERSEISEQGALIDRYNADLFFKSFKNQTMNYKECPTEEHCERSIKHAEGQCETDEQRLRWRHLFPCSSDYLSYPRPVFSKHLLKWQKRGSKVYAPIIYAKALDLLMRTARIAFSESFASLLEILSLLIGEEQKVVYAFMLMIEMMFINCQTESFASLLEILSLLIGEEQKVVYAFMLMIEMMFINCQTIKDFKELIENRCELMTCVQFGSLDRLPRQAEVTLRRIDEDVSSADYRYEIVDFGDFIERAAKQEGTFISHTMTVERDKRSRRKRRAAWRKDVESRKTYGLRRPKVSRSARLSRTKYEKSQERNAERSGRRTLRSAAHRVPADGVGAEELNEEDHQGTSRNTADEELESQHTGSDVSDDSEFSPRGKQCSLSFLLFTN
ncbi:hypothetical protein Tcan_02774 [Toxocara canis]|uniref:Rrn7/TAF1B C-terminal cyclin domain-containing protein n=1 Tax=Toxocara canis TaxID=6265 RepID=A0A0B2VLR2_TOXCA|nr:hypothetical protein Tcan_02774 [Toxocara canis]